MTKWFFRDTVLDAAYTEKSTDTADKTASDADLFNMTQAQGATLLTGANITNTVATLEEWFHKAFATPALAAQSVASADWTMAIAPIESNIGLNHAMRWYVYVLRAGANVITILGPVNEATEDATTRIGRIHTVTAVAGFTLQANDQIVVEVWSQGTASMTTNWTENVAFGGTQDIVDETTVLTSPAGHLNVTTTINEGAGPQRFDPTPVGIWMAGQGRRRWPDRRLRHPLPRVVA